MLRLIFVTSQLLSGGAERHAVSVMNRLGERGHECHAVYIKSGSELVETIRLRERGTVLGLDAARYLDRRAVADFAAHIYRVRPSAIVAANPYALLYSTLALRMSGVRATLVATYHSTRLFGLKEKIMMLGYRPLFWAADCTIFVSAAQSRYCMRRGVFSRRNEVIHNGVDAEWFRDAAECGSARRTLGFSDGDYVIGLLAELRPEKNHVQLVETIARLRGRGIPARALMIGDGAMRAAVEGRARELRVARDVAITGQKSDVRPYISACDAMVLCSTAVETFSLAALEAMAMGKPVIHSDVGGAEEMIFPGWNGYLFPAGDTRALVNSLALLEERAVAARMGRNARRAVEALFSERVMVDRYEQTLLELCSPTCGPRGLWSIRDRVNNSGAQ